MAFIIVLVAMLVFMYFLLIRPQRAKQRQAQELLSSIKPHQWQYLRRDTGDVPVGGPAPTPQRIVMAQAV